MATRRDTWGRREFLGGMAGAAGYLSLERRAGAEPPPETTRLRVAQSPAICFAAKYVASDGLFQAEGFPEVQYVKAPGNAYEPLVSGEADLAAADAPSLIVALDKGLPIVLLMGLHLGCYELFGSSKVSSIRDLGGKKIAVVWLNSSGHLMLSIMLAYVGIDPNKDVHWVTPGPGSRNPTDEAMQLLAEGKVDAYIGFPPEPQELRAQKIGRVLVSTTLDRPWSEYFCCFVAARQGLRPEASGGDQASPARDCQSGRRVRARTRARRSVPCGPRLHAGLRRAVQTLKELPYGKWRDYNPADRLRFYALRLHEAAMIKSSPQKTHRPGDRLAVPQRAEEGAEGMKRREFLTRTSLGGAATLLGVRPTPAGAEPPPETTRGLGWSRFPASVRTLSTWRKSSCGVKGSPMCSMSRRSAPRGRASLGLRRGGPQWTLCWHPCSSRLEAGDPIVILAGDACWVLRAVRHAPDPNDPRS